MNFLIKDRLLELRTLLSSSPESSATCELCAEFLQDIIQTGLTLETWELAGDKVYLGNLVIWDKPFEALSLAVPVKWGDRELLLLCGARRQAASLELSLICLSLALLERRPLKKEALWLPFRFDCSAVI